MVSKPHGALPPNAKMDMNLPNGDLVKGVTRLVAQPHQRDDRTLLS